MIFNNFYKIKDVKIYSAKRKGIFLISLLFLFYGCGSDNEIEKDTISPTLTLNGENLITLKVGDAYIDAGATAIDDSDGDITANIHISNSGDFKSAGTYTVIYNVSDAAGNKADEITRTVNVVEKSSFSIEIRLHTNDENLGAFNIYLDFNPAEISIDTDQGESGLAKGIDSSEYSMMSNPNEIDDGHYRFAGISASNFANGTDEHIATIHAKSLSDAAPNVSNLSIRANELVNELGQEIPTENVTISIQ